MPIIVEYTKNDDNYITLIDGKTFNTTESEMKFLLENKTFECQINDEIHKKLINLHLGIQFNGYKYDGDLLNGQPYGFGKAVYRNGDKYEGEFQNGQRYGKGIIIYRNGDKYEGEFQNGQRHGKGIIVYRNGDKYEGEFQNNQMHGKCIMTYIDGDKYEGEFQNGWKVKGIMTYANGDKYNGEFQNGWKVKGIMTYANGNKFEGEFETGDKRGKGIMTCANFKLLYNKLYDEDSKTYIKVCIVINIPDVFEFKTDNGIIEF